MMAKKRKYSKKKKKHMLWIVLAIALGALLLFGFKGCSTGLNLGDEFIGGGDETGGTSTAGGGGGGGGSTATDDCGADWISDSFPTLNTLWVGEDGLEVDPLITKTGHWECVGTCADAGNRCVLEPTNEIPEDGWDSLVGSKPNCVCLTPEGGPCNFYDENYGEDEDDIECGGSCPSDQECVTWGDSVIGSKFCECKYSDPDDANCGFHFPAGVSEKNYVNDPEEAQKYCYGGCKLGGTCTFDPVGITGLPTCGCAIYDGDMDVDGISDDFNPIPLPTWDFWR